MSWKRKEMNIVSAAFKANPFPVLARLRSEEPVHPPIDGARRGRMA
ncbi:MAG TPA: hypothetical protein VIQ24_08505 [Pyrinomonadaceae bacterium]